VAAICFVPLFGVFTALQLSSRSLAMSNPSVRPFDRLVNCDKQKEISARILIQYESMLEFSDTKMVGRGHPLLPEILGQTDCSLLETATFK